MITSTLRRQTIVTDAAEFEKRQAALAERLQPLLERQNGFISREMRGEPGGAMIEVTRWKTEGDCRSFLRNGAAAMAATIIDAFYPTAPFPDGTWIRETSEVAS